MISQLVSFDPSTITITRHTKVPNAGGFSWTHTTLTPFTARLYWYGVTSRGMREMTLPEGEVKTVELGLLVDGRANIRVGHASYDTFDVLSTDSPPESRTFRIIGVRYYDDISIDDHTQADAVAI